MRSPAQNRTGAALLLVLSSIALLMLAVQVVLVILDSTMEEAVHDARRFYAGVQAENGAMLAMNAKVEPGDPLLEKIDETGDGYRVRISNVGALIDPNSQLGDEEGKKALSRLWMQWGLNLLDAETLTDRLGDWVDPDDERLPRGAEMRDYPKEEGYLLPGNRALRNTGEMRQVWGFEEVNRRHPEWAASFGFYGQTQVDLNEASPEIVQAFTDVDDLRLEGFLDAREAAFTKNDGKTGFADIEEARNALGVSAEQFEPLASRLVVGSQIRMIESTGIAGGLEVKCRVVADVSSAPPRIIAWSAP